MAEANATMVMRSVYLPPEMDSALRAMAFQLRLSKADLIRAFVASGMQNVQRKLGERPDEAVIAKVAAALGSAQLPVQEVRRADAAIERMRSAAAESKRSFAAT